MSQWSFVIAAYSVVGFTTLCLVIWSFADMRRAEADAEAVKRR